MPDGMRSIEKEPETAMSEVEALSWLLFRLSNRVSDLEMLLCHVASESPQGADLLARGLAAMQVEKGSRMEALLEAHYAKMKEINAPEEIVELKLNDLRRVGEFQAQIAKQSHSDAWTDWAQDSLYFQGELILRASTGLAMYPDPDATKPQVEEVAGARRMARGEAG